ncbi:Manganese transport system membrane protein MntB [compost metagenome]
MDPATLQAMLAVAATSLTLLALIYRPLALDSLDPLFLRSVSRAGPLAYGLFLALVVLNLVTGFHAIGALMVVGLMMLPAAAARFWSRRLPLLLALAAALGALCVWLGLLLSFHANLPSGPCIVLLAGLAYVLSVLGGPVHGLLRCPSAPVNP